MNDIRFLKIRQQGQDSIQLAVRNPNRKIAFDVSMIATASKIYKQDDKFVVDLRFDHHQHADVLQKMKDIKKFVVQHLWKHKLLDPNDKLLEVQNKFVDHMLKKQENNKNDDEMEIAPPPDPTQKPDQTIFTVEIHPDCQFLKTSGVQTYFETPENIDKDDILDVIMVFTGIRFNPTSFMIKYQLYKVKKHFIPEVDTENLICTMDDLSLEYDHQKYIAKCQQKFAKFIKN